MNEAERARILARAIDSLIDGTARSRSHAASQETDIEALIAVARERLRVSRFVEKASEQHRTTVWRSLAARIRRDRSGTNAPPPGPQGDDSDLAPIIAARKRMAEQSASLAESHRHEMWEKVRERLDRQPRFSAPPAHGQRARRESDRYDEAGPRPEAERDQIQLPPSRPRLAMGQMAEDAQEMARVRVWARVVSSVQDQEPSIRRPGGARHHHNGSRLAFAAAAAVIAVLAIGPLPATGFAEHPAARLFNAIGGYVGAQEADPAAVDALPAPQIVEGTELGVREASAIAGLRFIEFETPASFDMTSSRYYSDGLSSSGGGMLVVTYASEEAVLTLYQEAAGGSALAAATGSLDRVTLADGTPATVVNGSWMPEDGALEWSGGDDQTLLFERGGVRVIAELRGKAPDPGFLVRFADSDVEN